MAFFLSSCARQTAQPLVKPALGTVCSVNAYEDGSPLLYGKVIERLEEIDGLFSTTRADSDISRVNEAAGKRAVAVHEEVFLVLEQALHYAEFSDGAFDPTIGPLVQLWGINTEDARVPSQEELDAALPLVDWRRVALGREERTVFLPEPGMALELGGIAKGYAADELAAILAGHKVRRAVIDLGGNVYVYGTKKDKSDWKVGIKDPATAAGPPALILSLPGGSSVVTSGVYERFFIAEDGGRYHHILDTRTGRPAERGYLSTTVISSSSLEADALSTTAFLLGAEEFAARFEAPAVFIAEDGAVTASPALAGRIAINAPWIPRIRYY